MSAEYTEVTKEHFYYWVAACHLWIDFFGLHDWECRFYFEEGDDDSPRACMQPFDMENRLLGLKLYDCWDIEPSDYNLFKVAFHECLEVLLVDINLGALRRDFNAELQDREHHRVIRRLESSVFENMWKAGDELFNFQSDAEGNCIARPEIPEFHNDENVLMLPDKKPDTGGRTDRLSPRQRITRWWDRVKAYRLP